MSNSVQAVMSIPIGQGRNISLTSTIMNYGHLLCPLVHSIHVPVDTCTVYGWSNTQMHQYSGTCPWLWLSLHKVPLD